MICVLCNGVTILKLLWGTDLLLVYKLPNIFMLIQNDDTKDV